MCVLYRIELCLLILCVTIISLCMCYHMGINFFEMKASDSLILSYLLETQFKASNRSLGRLLSLSLFFYFVSVCLHACLKLSDIRWSGIIVAIVTICYGIEKKIRLRHDLLRLFGTSRQSLVIHNHRLRQLAVFW